MSATIANQIQSDTRVKPKPRLKRYISLDMFYRHYNDREDGYKYEWNNGTVEKKPRMKQAELHIYNNLLRLFMTTSAFQEGGMLAGEIETMTTVFQLRKPDIAFFSAEQVKRADDKNAEIPAFVVELISKNDVAYHLQEKLDEYFDAGVQVAWLIYPQVGRVYIYHSPEDVVVCKGEDVCSAAPALLDFSIKAKDVFKK